MQRAILMTGIVLTSTLGACARLQINESYLSTNQRVAVVEAPGNGVTPPATVVLLETEPGKFATLQPIATGFGLAPVTAAVAGVGGATAGAVGYYAGQRARKADSTQVSVNQGGQTQAQTQDQIQQMP